MSDKERGRVRQSEEKAAPLLKLGREAVQASAGSTQRTARGQGRAVIEHLLIVENGLTIHDPEVEVFKDSTERNPIPQGSDPLAQAIRHLLTTGDQRSLRVIREVIGVSAETVRKARTIVQNPRELEAFVQKEQFAKAKAKAYILDTRNIDNLRLPVPISAEGWNDPGFITELNSTILQGARVFFKGDREDMLDIVQQGVAKIFTNRGNVQGDLYRYAIDVGKSVAIDFLRAKSVRNREIPSAMETEVESRYSLTPDIAETVVVQQIVRDAMQPLSKDHKEVLMLVYWRGLTMREAAERLGVPEGTIKSRLHNAIKALSNQLQQE